MIGSILDITAAWLRKAGNGKAPAPCDLTVASSSLVQRTFSFVILVSLSLAVLLSTPGTSAAATPVNGDKIINRATLSTFETLPSKAAITVTVIIRTKSVIELMTYAPGVSGAVVTVVPDTWYKDASGTFAILPPPTAVGSGTVIDLSAPVPLLPTTLFHTGEPIFIKATDLDQNVDKTIAETIIITINDPVTGDIETLRLTESGPDTGIFIGFIQSSSAATISANGMLSVIYASSIAAHYTDPVDGTDSSSATALVDPFGLVFDTVTGLGVNGATVKLLNAADGSLAIVYGDSDPVDETNLFPSEITTGTIVKDTAGNSYDFTAIPGSYRFPYVKSGNYILRVEPPKTYSAPSTVPTTVIQTLPGAPFAIKDPGSRDQVFNVPLGPALQIDLPIDPKIGTLWLTKAAGRSIVSAGEYLPYVLILENNDPVGTVFSPVITDKLPPGFRYQKGSASVNGHAVPDPAISSDGSTMTFSLGSLSPSTSVTIRYVVAVGAGANIGTAVNSAVATASAPVATASANASVLVQEPFMQSRNIIMGRVFVGTCGENPDDNKKGMEGVGIYLEDGTFVFSDQLGKFHFEGVRSGVHVVQLDLDSVPEGYKVLPCVQNSRFAGRSFSQFVDMQGGTMWRTDFYLGKIEPAVIPAETTVPALMAAPTEYKGEITLEMLSSQNDDIIDYRLPLNSHTVLLKNIKLIVKLPTAATYIPGSSTFNGISLTDPEITGSTLTYSLEDADESWVRELQFRARFDKKRQAGDLETSAVLTFDTSLARNVSTPEVTNTLAVIWEEKFVPLPLFIIRPHFPSFSAELSDLDRQQLDELIGKLNGKIVERIDVSGHTDSVRIAPRSREIYPDNLALSMARAKSVGRYLTAALHLPPAALFLNGSADKEPVASNSNAEGRALNRRVEVKISALEIIESSDLKITRERSGIQKSQTVGGSVTKAAELLNETVPLQVTNGPDVKQALINPSAAVTETAIPPVSAAKQVQEDVEPLTVPVITAENSAERALMNSVGNDGIVHYRIRLNNIKEAFQNATVTLIMPANLLYMSGTTQLGGKTVNDPEVLDSVLKYSFNNLTDERLLDLRLQALVDGDILQDNAISMLSVIISDTNGKQINAFNVTSQLSEDMAEITRPDIVIAKKQEATLPLSRSDRPVAPLPVASGEKLLPSESFLWKNEGDEYHEQVKSASSPSTPVKASTEKTNSVLQVMDDAGILSPAEGSYVATQYNSVRIVLDSTLKPSLLLDGQEISAERIGFSMDDKESGKTLHVYIGIDFGEPGAHQLQLKGLDQFGVTRFENSSNVTRTGEITTIRLISAEGNVADGRTPVKMRIQLFDKDDKPVAANAEILLKSSDLRPLSIYGNSGLNSDTGRVSLDSKGWINFQPVNSGGNYRATLSFNKAVLDVETYVKPMMRDWILVGLAEGTTGYNTVSGNMENLSGADQDEDLYENGRVALYAKGTVKGEWLLTMAYDSAKKKTGVGGNSLFQTVDPNSYYTIYGDGSSQIYDAASQEKLYLKIERENFYAMFGDFNSGLTVTELSRYSRSMTGIKSEYRDKTYDLTVFGSETGQSFVKDELRGDGTSGLYHLSKKGIVLNSEKITIESRDRFHSEIITDTRQLSRFVDYSIDYDSGTIFFKSPVPNRDDKFNPVFIVIDYEILNAGKDSLTYGGRAAARLLNGKIEVGGTHVHEGQVNGDNNLYGVDASAFIAPGTKARAEFATTDNNSTVKSSGSAYLAEVTHTGKKFDGRIYFKEQQTGFGLGQQNSSEAGTRKYGVDSGYRLNEKVTLNGQAYKQYNLATDAVRDFMEVLASYNEKQYTMRSGMRYANDTLADGKNESSVLATVGGSWRTRDQKLTLRADHDQSLFSKNNSTDFPTRTIFGIDYQATKVVMLFAQEELTYGAYANTNTTTAGVKSTPWSGGTLNSSVVNDIRENSERTFANVGLTQKWLINPKWAVDGEIGHSETVRKKTGYTMNANVPPASGGQEFTAVSLGANFTEKRLLWSNRVEYRNSPNEDKWGLMTGLINEHGLNWGWTSRLQLYHTQGDAGNSSTTGDLRLGFAYRPPVTKWIILDRLDLTYSDIKSANSSIIGKRLVNNLNANYKPNKKSQISLQYGAKYVFEKIDKKDYSGFTDLIGVEGRYDITKKMDVGVRASLLHTWETDQYAYSVGPSVGYNVMENAWISGGYNVTGFTDNDFSDSNYTSQGPFIQYRFKFDQQSVKDGLKALGSK